MQTDTIYSAWPKNCNREYKYYGITNSTDSGVHCGIKSKKIRISF